MGSVNNLSVLAVSPDGGMLYYDWYSCDDQTGANAKKIDNANGPIYSVEITKEVSYYFVEITNYNPDASGTKEATVRSAVAWFVVTEGGAEVPVIKNLTENLKVKAGELFTLSVEANNPTDGGTLSYQWFQNDLPNIAGGITPGANIFYVEVTNTNNNPEVTGNNVTMVRSNNGAIIIDDDTLPTNWVERITIVNTSAPVYGFHLPTGETFGAYDRVLLDMRAINDFSNQRLRTWGNYALGAWPNVNSRPDMRNASPDGLILSTAGIGSSFTLTAAEGWTNQTVIFDNRAALNTSAAINASTGVIAFAIGVIPQGGGTATNVYEIRNIRLSNTAGDKTVPALHPQSPILWLGQGAGAYVTQAGADAVTRVLQ
jgi:hypothetical protein